MHQIPEVNRSALQQTLGFSSASFTYYFPSIINNRDGQRAQRRRVRLTGSCFSRQLLKFLVWLGFSFFRGIRVSPMNSLWRNLSSSHTEILSAGGESGKSQKGREETLEAARGRSLQTPAASRSLQGGLKWRRAGGKDSTSGSHR